MIKDRSKKMYGYGVSVNQKMECLLIAYCLGLFVLWVPLFEERKHGVAVPGKLWNSAN